MFIFSYIICQNSQLIKKIKNNIIHAILETKC